MGYGCGSSGFGTVFEVATDGAGFTNLHSFTGSDGAYPIGGLILSGDTLYGTTFFGGTWGNGTVFAVNTDGTGLTNLYSFGGIFLEGDSPSGGLILSGNSLYGTTQEGGTSNKGTVFKVNINGDGFTNLHNFVGSPSGGANPVAGLILSGNTLYGTSSYGGSSGNGTVFKLNTDGTGFAKLHSFAASSTNSSGTYTNSDGASPPYGRLILTNNTLYGTAFAGGSSGNGTVFSIFILPELTIIPSGVNVILTWPTNYAGFTLQSTTNLVSPAVWTTVSPGPGRCERAERSDYPHFRHTEVLPLKPVNERISQ